jgi:hypothetical protein
MAYINYTIILKIMERFVLFLVIFDVNGVVFDQTKKWNLNVVGTPLASGMLFFCRIIMRISSETLENFR